MDDQEPWHNSTHAINGCWPRSHSVRKYDRLASYGNMAGVRRANKVSMWTQMWREMKRGSKKRMFRCSNSTSLSYDEHSYSQNFDPGSVRGSLENLRGAEIDGLNVDQM
ncbi:Unknown protein [Striga hermonthica]|uniref:Uncharacterized protein n=1 Tax=Striga hermonthica TaxID=68872 RepID=A0A9N7RMP2_STRHE|nr:Unknown protein [Striga hermonthica]